MLFGWLAGWILSFFSWFLPSLLFSSNPFFIPLSSPLPLPFSPSPSFLSKAPTEVLNHFLSLRHILVAYGQEKCTLEKKNKLDNAQGWTWISPEDSQAVWVSVQISLQLPWIRLSEWLSCWTLVQDLCSGPVCPQHGEHHALALIVWQYAQSIVCSSCAQKTVIRGLFNTSKNSFCWSFKWCTCSLVSLTGGTARRDSQNCQVLHGENRSTFKYTNSVS